MSDSDDDLEEKSFRDSDLSEESFSNEKPLKESISIENSKKIFEEEKFKENKKHNKKEDKKKGAIKVEEKIEEISYDKDSSEKKRDDKKEYKSESDSDSSIFSSKNKKKENSKKAKKENIKDLIKDLESDVDEEEDKKEDKKEKFNDDNKREEKKKEDKKKEERKKKRKDEEKIKEEKIEKERKKGEKRRKNEDRERNDYQKSHFNNNNSYGYNINNNDREYRNNNNERNVRYCNDNNTDSPLHQNKRDKRNDDIGSYQQRSQKKFDLNEIKELNKIVSDNIEIINEMKSAYPGFTQIECASVLKKIKNSNSQTIFEIMNQIHREICIQITLNEADNRKKNAFLFPLDLYEVIDPFYNNQEHIKVMKYYKIYSNKDKNKLPPYVKKILEENTKYYYTDENNRRRKVIKYPDGGFNYIPINCEYNCGNESCPYSHNQYEMEYHPLFYKTKYSSTPIGYLEKNANNLKDDFRIIYNYKNEKIINLLKLIDEKKIAKISFKGIFKNKINSFDLETFKTIECPSVKNNLTCPKDSHLCYFYHTLSERRRPPSLYRYTNEMCTEQKYSEAGKIIKKCKNADFCNLCHSRYEYYYHKLFYGKAMTCIRPKHNGKCIFEETCYAYHPYKEPGYKKTKEEIIQEKKDELMDKYTNEYNLLNGLIHFYKCQNCKKCNKKLEFYYLVNCQHIICRECFLEIENCPICKEKFDNKKKEEDFIIINIKESAQNIDDLIKKKYEKSQLTKEKEKNKEESKDKKENKDSNKKNQKKEKNDSDNEKDNINNSMG